MRIGILTYHQAENFGAVMQVYALQRYLKEQGHYVEIIDYHCFAIKVHYQILNPSILLSRKNIFQTSKEYFGRFIDIKSRSIRKRKFKEFTRKHLILSKHYNKITSPLPYDLIIVGSDQVWNFHLNKGSENIYLLDIPVNANTQKIAYAASSEVNGLNNISTSMLKRCLASFNKISVRESFLKNSLSPYSNKRIEVCVDPTFLLSKNEYLSIASDTYCKSKNYILVYHMTPMLDYMEFIKEIAIKENCEIVEIYGGYSHNKSNSKIVSTWGPCDVIGLIANAQKIFTTSFHGLALSLILEKNVWVVDKENNYRQRNLLKLSNLSNRLLKNTDSYNELIIDYNNVRQHLYPIIAKSKDFLIF